MKRNLLTLMAILFAAIAFSQMEPPKMKPEMTEIWDPEIRIITPGVSPADAPSDAIILFNGTDIESEWTSGNGEKPGWIVENGCVTVKKGTGTIKTKRKFNDFQLHIEWRTPSEVIGTSQGRGNSGIFMQEKYELQVLDNFENRTYRNGQAGSIYKQNPPLVNACKKPGEWQTYDIVYTAPRFNEDGSYFTPPTITVIHNGVLVQNNYKLRGPTEYIGIPEYTIKKHDAGSLVLQDHGNPVSYKNIWIREL